MHGDLLCVIVVSFGVQVKQVGEVCVVVFSWFKFHVCVKRSARQHLQWLLCQKDEHLCMLGFMFFFRSLMVATFSFHKFVTFSLAWHWIEEESHARGVRIPGPPIIKSYLNLSRFSSLSYI